MDATDGGPQAGDRDQMQEESDCRSVEIPEVHRDFGHEPRAYTQHDRAVDPIGGDSHGNQVQHEDTGR